MRRNARVFFAALGLLGTICLVNRDVRDDLFLRPAFAAGLPREIIGADGAPMVLVPRGEFLMGAQPGNFIFGDNERPPRLVYLDDFYIDKFEVTNRRFLKILKPAESYSGTFLQPEQPIVGVTWYQARDYCTQVKKRLPTEAEWEKAARGTDGRTYPWGNEPATCDRAIMGGEIPSCDRGYSTWEVGSRPAGRSPYGALDMAGNAMEWVRDWYFENYYKQGAKRNPGGPRNGDLRVLRGGAWFNSAKLMRTSFRTGFDPNKANHGVGFRCARKATVGFVQRMRALRPRVAWHRR